MKHIFYILLSIFCLGFVGCKDQNNPELPDSSKTKGKEYYVKYTVEVTNGSIGSGSYVMYKQASGVSSTQYLYSSNTRWSKEIGPVKKGFTATLQYSFSPYGTKGKGTIYVKEKNGVYQAKRFGISSSSSYLSYTINE